MKTLLLLISLISPVLLFSQRAKNGDLTITAANTVVNSYTALTVNATVGSTSISVASNTLSLTLGTTTTSLAAGDLIFIIQMQGASLDINNTPVVSWGGDYTLSSTAMADIANWKNYDKDFGNITNYNNCGKYEMAEVRSVSGANTITLMCGLKFDYTVSGRVQVIRVPRLNNLNLNANQSITSPSWNGTTGGLVVLEVNGNVTFGNNSRITVTGRGFRGGNHDFTNGITLTGTAGHFYFPGTTNNIYGAPKGESIGGSTADYTTLYSSRFGRGAPGNGGGGGNNHNAGGGGGSNIGTGTYTGRGVPSTAGSFTTAWNLEDPTIVSAPSSGGGRGGYTFANNDANELTVGPGNAGWTLNASNPSDFRRVEGGLGGKPLTYDANRIFLGGGGGSGHENSVVSGVPQGGIGGNGGGIVFMTVYGTISGTGSIEADGENGGNTNAANSTAGAVSGTKFGNDGAGGAGGGGAIVISNGTAIPATVSLLARGGNGGNNQMSFGNFSSPATEANGPGGGGAGGMVSFSSGTPVQAVTGGNAGIVTTNKTNIVANFNVNGATGGASGMSGLAQNFFNITAANVNICSGQTATLTATVVGTLPVGTTIHWYATQFGSPISSGTTFTTPTLTTTTTYYVGTCPGTFRLPVVVTVGGPTISGTAAISNATCSTGGSITGLTASGGVPSLAYSWNSVSTPSANLTGASTGSYTLTVTDGAGCTSTSGPYTIAGVAGPTINTSAVSLTNPNCLGNNGSIAGITASGVATLTYSWSNGGGSALNANSLAAGPYTLTVTDGNSCISTAGPFTLTAIPGPSINSSAVSVTNTSCGNANGSITGLTASGSGLTYSWNSGVNTNLNPTGLAAGSYNLVVTNGLGCTANYGPVSIAASTSPIVNSAAQVITNDHCAQNIGAISGLTVSSGTSPYTYSWNSGANTNLNPTNLGAGSYNLVVSDFAGCTTNYGPVSISNIAGPTINSSGVSITNQTCVGNDGAIDGITVSGTGTLTYSWNLAPATGPSLSGVNAGSYGLLVVDNFGCQAAAGPFVVGSTGGPTINTAGLALTQPTCANNDGQINGITATGTGLTYAWTNTAQTVINPSGLGTGAYSLTVTDNLGCQASVGPFALLAGAGPVIDDSGLTVTQEICSSSNGSIIGLFSSGSGLTYSWSGSSATSIDIISLDAGSYTLTVEDNNGCTDTYGPITISNSAPPVLNGTPSVADENCGNNDGSISGLTVSGGAIPLTYSWNGGVSTALNPINLNQGNYTLIVTDNIGCTDTLSSVAVNENLGPVLNETNVTTSDESCDLNDGSITGITATGLGTLTYSWDSSPAQTTLNATNLSAGNYTLTVTDGFNCSVTTGNYPIIDPTPITIDASLITLTNELCGQNNGSVNGITVNGGTAPLLIQWDGNNSALDVFQAFSSGNHTLIVSDNFSCADTLTITINETAGPTLDTTNMVVVNESCENLNGSISGIVANGVGPFTYSWSNGNNTQNLMNVAGGDYELTVTDNNGCEVQSGMISIISNPLPNADFSINPSVVLPNDLVTFTNNSTGTIAQSSWDIENLLNDSLITNLNYTFLSEGEYAVTLTIVSTDGCIDSLTKIVTVFGELIIPNVVTCNGDGSNDLFEVKNLKPNTKVIIQNRWGNSVFETNDYQNDWGGKDQHTGDKLEDGVYFYQILIASGEIFHGYVHLINK
ncbi:MAG: gliding motility-associated C-terminal domain-containing protein [Fluviicola sp.]